MTAPSGSGRPSPSAADDAAFARHAFEPGRRRVATVHRFERETLIRFSHCDPAGIVFFPHYLVLFNQLLEDWFNDVLGVPYGPMVTERRLGTPTVSLQCDFTAVSRVGDMVLLGLSVRRVGPL